MKENFKQIFENNLKVFNENHRLQLDIDSLGGSGKKYYLVQSGTQNKVTVKKYNYSDLIDILQTIDKGISLSLGYYFDGKTWTKTK